MSKNHSRSSRGWLLSFVLPLAWGLTSGCAQAEVSDFDPAVNEFETETQAVSSPATQVVYVNFDGPTLTYSSSDNAVDNQCAALHAFWPSSSSIDFSPYASTAGQATVLSFLKSVYAPYNISFVTSRPSSGPYTMVVISPLNAPHHGVAPLNCNNSNNSNIALVTKIGDHSADYIGRAAAHELGHSLGLAHVLSSSDIMHWDSSGHTFTTSAYDTGHPSGKCMSGDTQDAPALLLAALGPACQPQAGFSDLCTANYQAAISWFAEQGYATSCAPGKFCPRATLTRDHMAAFLDRVLHLPATTTDYFDDDSNNPYSSSINRVSAKGITTGCDANDPRKYCPNKAVTRQQMAKFLVSALQLPAANTDYFTDDDGLELEPYINALRASGITYGCTATTFCPWDNITREQAVKFLYSAHLAGLL